LAGVLGVNFDGQRCVCSVFFGFRFSASVFVVVVGVVALAVLDPSQVKLVALFWFWWALEVLLAVSDRFRVAVLGNCPFGRSMCVDGLEVGVGRPISFSIDNKQN
jgi:hypothetical protein